MEIINKKIKDIKPYEKNPRNNKEAVKYVANSIKEFGFKVPIVIDKENVIVCGHTRLQAAKRLKLKEVPCIIADDLTDEQIKAFRLADNKVSEFAEWNFDYLNEELGNIIDINMEDFGFKDFSENIEEIPEENISDLSLSDKFIVPPFSVLDQKSANWQKRKDEWLRLGIKSEKGRDEKLIGDTPKFVNGVRQERDNFTSIFDPVLCEISYRWFNIKEGKVFDCFAGGSVRGIVAEKLGYKYLGIDLRKEQIEANYENAKEIGVNPKWVCDDSLNADKYIEDNSADMIFSCPPYADLEVYSNDPRDISNMDYDKFCEVYKKIIDIACRKLKENRFAVFVVGDVRDKKGAYRNFVDFTKKCFNDNGLITYNELILLNQYGSSAVRAQMLFRNRKVCKVHQNVLVFYKGDMKKIKDFYKMDEFQEAIEEILKEEE